MRKRGPQKRSKILGLFVLLGLLAVVSPLALRGNATGTGDQAGCGGLEFDDDAPEAVSRNASALTVGPKTMGAWPSKYYLTSSSQLSGLRYVSSKLPYVSKRLDTRPAQDAFSFKKLYTVDGAIEAQGQSAGDHVWAFKAPRTSWYGISAYADYAAVLYLLNGKRTAIIDADYGGSEGRGKGNPWLAQYLQAETTYYIVVDGSKNGDAGHYTLSVSDLSKTLSPKSNVKMKAPYYAAGRPFDKQTIRLHLTHHCDGNGGRGAQTQTPVTCWTHLDDGVLQRMRTLGDSLDLNLSLADYNSLHNDDYRSFRDAFPEFPVYGHAYTFPLTFEQPGNVEMGRFRRPVNPSGAKVAAASDLNLVTRKPPEMWAMKIKVDHADQDNFPDLWVTEDPFVWLTPNLPHARQAMTANPPAWPFGETSLNNSRYPIELFRLSEYAGGRYSTMAQYNLSGVMPTSQRKGLYDLYLPRPDGQDYWLGRDANYYREPSIYHLADFSGPGLRFAMRKAYGEVMGADVPYNVDETVLPALVDATALPIHCRGVRCQCAPDGDLPLPTVCEAADDDRNRFCTEQLSQRNIQCAAGETAVAVSLVDDPGLVVPQGAKPGPGYQAKLNRGKAPTFEVDFGKPVLPAVLAHALQDPIRSYRLDGMITDNFGNPFQGRDTTFSNWAGSPKVVPWQLAGPKGKPVYLVGFEWGMKSPYHRLPYDDLTPAESASLWARNYFEMIGKAREQMNVTGEFAASQWLPNWQHLVGDWAQDPAYPGAPTKFEARIARAIEAMGTGMWSEKFANFNHELLRPSPTKIRGALLELATLRALGDRGASAVLTTPYIVWNAYDALYMPQHNRPTANHPNEGTGLSLEQKLVDYLLILDEEFRTLKIAPSLRTLVTWRHAVESSGAALTSGNSYVDIPYMEQYRANTTIPLLEAETWLSRFLNVEAGRPVNGMKCAVGGRDPQAQHYGVMYRQYENLLVLHNVDSRTVRVRLPARACSTHPCSQTYSFMKMARWKSRAESSATVPLHMNAKTENITYLNADVFNLREDVLMRRDIYDPGDVIRLRAGEAVLLFNDEALPFEQFTVQLVKDHRFLGAAAADANAPLIDLREELGLKPDQVTDCLSPPEGFINW